MLITQVLAKDAEEWRIYLLRAFVERLCDRFDFEVIVPEGSRVAEAFLGVRAKLTALPLDDDNMNMIRNIYILSKHFAKSGTGIVHSHGSVSGSLSGFLASRGDIVAIKDYYASLMLGRVVSALSPRAKLSLTLSYSPSDRGILTRYGVREGSIVSVPWGIEFSPYEKFRGEKGDRPIVIALCRDREECALFLSAAALLVRRYYPIFYIEIPEGLEHYVRHLASALGIGRSIVSFAIGSLPGECTARALCFVFPTLSPHAVPLEAARFMSCGIPAVVPDTPRCIDLVKNCYTGGLFRFGDSFSLSSAVERMLTRDEDREALSLASRKRVESFCSLDSSLAALAGLYERLSSEA